MMDIYYKGEKQTASGGSSSNRIRQWVTVYPEWEFGKYWSTDGTKKDVPTTLLTNNGTPHWHSCLATKDYISIGSATRIKYRLFRQIAIIKDYAQIVLFDADYNILYNTNNVLCDDTDYWYIDIPDGAVYMVFNNCYNSGVTVQLYADDYEQTPENSLQLKTLFDSTRQATHREFTPKTCAENTKAYIIFREDDSNGDVDLTEKLFEDNGIPVTFAVQPIKLWGMCCNGLDTEGFSDDTRSRYIVDVFKAAEEAGMEIAIHGEQAITPNTMLDYEFMYHVLVNGKKEVTENYGLHPVGMIAIGGVDSEGASFDDSCKPTTRDWVEHLYRYSDLYGDCGQYQAGDNCHTWNMGTRISSKETETFVSEFKARVNQAIADKETLVLLWHYLIPKYNEEITKTDAGYAPYAAMKECVEWCTTLSSDDVEFTTYRDYINSHYYGE